MNTESSGCYVIDSDYNIVNMNSIAYKTYPQLAIGKKCYKCLMDLDEPCGPCPVAAGRKGPTTYTDPIRHISEIVDAVDIDIDGFGQCHALIFSTVENEASFAATLPTSAQELKNLALIKALTGDYADVFSVNLTQGNITLYRLNGKALGDDSVLKETPSYEKKFEEYIEKYVVDEDRDMLRRQCSLSYMKEELKKSESMTIHYRVLLGGTIHYYYRKIVRIGTSGFFQNIVVGVGCEDEEVKNRKKQIHLQNTLRKVELSSVTGLLTKEAFLIYGDRLLQKHPDTDFDMGILKIDNLDSIYRQYGSMARDRLLRTVGEVLKTHTKEKNCIAYLGDDLFCSFSENQKSDVRKKVIESFRADVTRDSDFKNFSFKWTFYKKVNKKLSTEKILSKMIRILSTIRPSVGDDYYAFDNELIEHMEWDFSVEQNFRKDLKNGEFVAWFQPKYSVETREIVGAEALVRWITSEGTIIPPSRFIPILENCGLINQLDEEIFRQVCCFQKELTTLDIRPIPISVNLSRASLFVQNIPEVYARIAAEYDVDPKLVPIEITESAAIRAIMFKSFAESLIEKGFSLHMDDFGSGYSSLASVQVIPFESIKLDKTLVDFIGKRSGESLLKHTIEFAKENGMSVIAEGVETAEQLIFLRIVGCDAIQGFFFSGPVEKSTFIDMLKKSEQIADKKI